MLVLRRYTPIKPLSDSYDWGDLMGSILTIKKKTDVYNIPYNDGSVTDSLLPGTIIYFDTFVNHEGRTWLRAFYSQSDYDTQTNDFWIPTSGGTADPYTVDTNILNNIDTGGILTTDQKAELNKTDSEKLYDTGKKLVLFGGALYLVHALIQYHARK